MILDGFAAAQPQDWFKWSCIRCRRNIRLGTGLEKVPLIALPKSNPAGFVQVCEELCEKLCEKVYWRCTSGLRPVKASLLDFVLSFRILQTTNALGIVSWKPLRPKASWVANRARCKSTSPVSGANSQAVRGQRRSSSDRAKKASSVQ